MLMRWLGRGVICIGVVIHLDGLGFRGGGGLRKALYVFSFLFFFFSFVGVRTEEFVWLRR